MSESVKHCKQSLKKPTQIDKAMIMNPEWPN